MLLSFLCLPPAEKILRLWVSEDERRRWFIHWEERNAAGTIPLARKIEIGPATLDGRGCEVAVFEEWQREIREGRRV